MGSGRPTSGDVGEEAPDGSRRRFCHRRRLSGEPADPADAAGDIPPSLPIETAEPAEAAARAAAAAAAEAAAGPASTPRRRGSVAAVKAVAARRPASASASAAAAQRARGWQVDPQQLIRWRRWRRRHAATIRVAMICER